VVVLGAEAPDALDQELLYATHGGSRSDLRSDSGAQVLRLRRRARRPET
jgi:hypothetical protein